MKPSLDLLDLEFNVTSQITSSTAARQAIAHAIDRKDLLEANPRAHGLGPGGQR